MLGFRVLFLLIGVRGVGFKVLGVGVRVVLRLGL